MSELRAVLEEVRVKQKRKKLYQRGLAMLMAITMLGTTMVLSREAETAEAETFCGYEEHVQHTDDCYKKLRTLICGQEEIVGHVHGEDCYVTENHSHTEDCYEEQTRLICGLEETAGHVHSEDGSEMQEEHIHDDSCYTTEQVLVCGKEEGENKTLICEQPETPTHEHDDACYEIGKEMLCEKALHEHSLQCFSNPDADVEDEQIWEASVAPAVLSGDYAGDLVAVAKTQLGYRESVYNYRAVNETEKKGYTRYGAWYGGFEYDAWCAMFVSFCLNYAGIPESAFPYEMGTTRWVDLLREKELWQDAEGYTPKAGDVVFFDWEEDGSADHVGIVSEVDEEAGSLTTIEGNRDPMVSEYSIALNDTAILGYGLLPARDFQCGLDEHQHTEDCYTQTLTLACGLEEGEEHQHTEACYETVRELGCGLNEHRHTEACYTEQTKELPAEDEQSAGPVLLSVVTASGITVTLTAPPESLPYPVEELSLSVTPVEDQGAEQMVKDAAETAAAGEKDDVRRRTLLFDICIMHNGEEVQPTGPVSVSFSGMDIPRDDAQIFHVSQDGAGVEEVAVETDEHGDLVMRAEHFSLYALTYTYTVDFHFGDYVFSIGGGTEITVSALLKQLGIMIEISDVVDVRFSNETLVKVTKLEGDWLLTSLAPFQTHESLTLILADGSELIIEVTDAPVLWTGVIIGGSEVPGLSWDGTGVEIAGCSHAAFNGNDLKQKGILSTAKVITAAVSSKTNYITTAVRNGFCYLSLRRTPNMADASVDVTLTFSDGSQGILRFTRCDYSWITVDSVIVANSNGVWPLSYVCDISQLRLKLTRPDGSVSYATPGVPAGVKTFPFVDPSDNPPSGSVCFENISKPGLYRVDVVSAPDGIILPKDYLTFEIFSVNRNGVTHWRKEVLLHNCSDPRPLLSGKTLRHPAQGSYLSNDDYLSSGFSSAPSVMENTSAGSGMYFSWLLKFYRTGGVHIFTLPSGADGGRLDREVWAGSDLDIAIKLGGQELPRDYNPAYDTVVPSGNLIPACSYTLTDAGGATKVYTANAKGLVTVDGLQPGTYTLRQTANGAGVLSGTVWRLLVDRAGYVTITKQSGSDARDKATWTAFSPARCYYDWSEYSSIYKKQGGSWVDMAPLYIKRGEATDADVYYEKRADTRTRNWDYSNYYVGTQPLMYPAPNAVLNVWSDTPGALHLNKYAKGTNSRLAGAVFRLTDSQGNSYDYSSLADRSLDISLSFGDYTLTELRAPNGYEKLDTVWNVHVADNGVVTISRKSGTATAADVWTAVNGTASQHDATLTVYDPERAPIASLLIDKYQTGTTVRVEGATFQLAGTQGTASFVTPAGSALEIPFYDAGSYTLKESAPPAGYSGVDTQWTVTVNANGSVTITRKSGAASGTATWTSTNSTASQSAKLTVYNDVYPVVRLYKHSLRTGELLGGVSFYFNGPGVNRTVTSSADGYVELPLPSVGTYTLSEQLSLAGYSVLDTLWSINYNGSRVTISHTAGTGPSDTTWTKHEYSAPAADLHVYNGNQGFVTIKKYALGTDTTLSGAVFALTNSRGNTTMLTTDQWGVATAWLDSGTTYTLREVTAPSGYVALNTVWSIVLDPTGGLVTVTRQSGTDTSASTWTVGAPPSNAYNGKQLTVYDPPKKDGAFELLVNKYAAGTSTRLGEAVFRLTDANGNESVYQTTAGNALTIPLSAGTFTLEEITPPYGYNRMDTVWNVSVSNYGVVTITRKSGTNTASNTWTRTNGTENQPRGTLNVYDTAKSAVGKLRINKYVRGTTSRLAGATFTLTTPDGQIANFVSNANQYLEIPLVQTGTYTLQESASPTGYMGLDTVWNVAVNANGNVTITRKSGTDTATETWTRTNGNPGVLTVYNSNMPRLKLYKHDLATGALLAGTRFSLENPSGSGQFLDSVSSGYLEVPLPELGKYVLQEYSSPAGYERMSTTWHVNVTADSVTVSWAWGPEESDSTWTTSRSESLPEAELHVYNGRPGKLEINKFLAGTSTRLNATFHWYGVVGGQEMNGGYPYTGTTGGVTIQLNQGFDDYQLHEYSAPSGYLKLNTVWNVHVDRRTGATSITRLSGVDTASDTWTRVNSANGNQTAVLNVYNYNVPSSGGKLEIEKYRIDDRTASLNTEFTLCRTDGTELRTWRTSSGKATIDLAYYGVGEYLLKEQRTNNYNVYYTDLDTVWKLKLDKDGRVTVTHHSGQNIAGTWEAVAGSGTTPTVLKVWNPRRAQLLIKKYDNAFKLLGATFELTDPDGVVSTIEISANNYYYYDFPVRNGTWYLRELRAPDGYMAQDTVWKIERSITSSFVQVTAVSGEASSSSTWEAFQVSSYNAYMTLEVHNWPKAKLQLYKYDGAGTDYLSGATFALYPNGTRYVTENGPVEITLDPGTYYLVEESAPDEYVASKTTWTISVSETFGAMTITGTDAPTQKTWTATNSANSKTPGKLYVHNYTVPDVEIHKSANPGTSYDPDNPTVVDRGSEIVYMIRVKNNETYSISDYLLEDTLPEWVTVSAEQKAAIQFSYTAQPDTKWNIPKTDWFDTPDWKGNTISLSGLRLEASSSSGSDLTIYIPCTVKADLAADTLIENTAKLLRVNNIDVDRSSETTYHTASKISSLTVHKNVVGASGELLNKQFRFKLSMKNAAGTAFDMTGLTLPDGEKDKLAEGEFIFTLKHGENMTIADLPGTATFILEELDHDGYRVYMKEGVVDVVAGDNSGELDLTRDRDITVHNTPGQALPNSGGMGTDTLYALGLVLMLLAGGGTLAAAAQNTSRRKRRSQE